MPFKFFSSASLLAVDCSFVCVCIVLVVGLVVKACALLRVKKWHANEKRAFDAMIFIV